MALVRWFPKDHIWNKNIFMRFPSNTKINAYSESKILNQIIQSAMNRFYSGLICNIWQKDWSCIVYKLIVAKYIWQLRSVIPLMFVAESFIIIIPKQNVRNTEFKNYAKYATTKFGNLTWHLGLLFWFWKKFLNVLNFHFFLKYIKTSNKCIQFL